MRPEAHVEDLQERGGVGERERECERERAGELKSETEKVTAGKAGQEIID